ncbi:alanine racemase, partial [Candidatus Peregrinibacteria bacterium]|nr:alanine racemase [Candidatus Peregrinibacteria bacterium]
MSELTWVEISRQALSNNIRQFRKVVGSEVILCPCVKANAYGHGLTECGKTFLEAGADWLSVNALYEARALRDAGVSAPIYILGYVSLDSLNEAVDLNCRLVVYNEETLHELGKIGKTVKIHFKVETGNNRQGLLTERLIELAKIASAYENIEIEGLATHFANIEDTTDHSYADKQLMRFADAHLRLAEAGFKIPIRHCANSAATILFPQTHFEMVRTGIANYGLWPSNETYVSYMQELAEGAIAGEKDFKLEPAFSWRARIAQVKTIAAGEVIGYGCTYKTTHETRLAIVPIGYYDGYDRGVSGVAHVLIHGKRAPLRGRVCMNIIMVEVSDIPEAKLEDEVTLIGRDGEEEISAELFASWAGT